MVAYDAIARIGRALPLVTTMVLVVGAVAIVSARAFASRKAAVRNLIWHAALLAAVVVPIAAVVGPVLRVRASEASTPALRTAQRALVATPNSSTPRGFDRSKGLGLLWLCGFALLSVRVARQLVAAERLRRRAVAAPFQPAFARALADAAYTRNVPILISLDVDVPLALGVFRPAIIVPMSSCEWSEEEWYVVLLHEAAHLARGDLAARTVGIVAGLLHWFNPLVPWIRRRLECDAELAADTVVLHAGVLASRYADVLLSMAERLSWRPSPEPLLTFARAAGLELRIDEVLRTSPDVAVMRRSTAMSVTMASALIAAILGCLQLTVQSPLRTSVPTPLAVDASDWRVSARSALVELLNDPSPQVRAAAAHSLEQMAAKP